MNATNTAFEENLPVSPKTYSIPFKEMKKLNAPVMNIGPFGRDAHKLTERLHMKNAFEELPILLEDVIQMMIHTKRKQ